MRKIKSLGLFLVLGLLLSMTTISLSTPTAHAAKIPVTSPCVVLQVTLHGRAAPTSQCLSQTLPNSRIGKIPHTGADTACPPNDLVLYWNSPISAFPNFLLCLIGFGELDLNQPLLTLSGTSSGNRNWNDQASAWSAGCADAEFFTDIQKGGNTAIALGTFHGLTSASGNFPYQGVGNDQLSSVDLHDVGLC